MQRHEPARLWAFLGKLDAQLAEPMDLIVIGGGALALAWDGQHATPDLDLFEAPKQPFLEAYRRLQDDPDFVPIDVARIATPPDDFEERLVPLEAPGWRWLRLWVPEAHDFALMKLARATSHDLDGVEALHRVLPLDLETLLQRLPEMLRTVTGPPERYRTSFLVLVERLWGTQQAEALEAKWSEGTQP